MPETAAAAAPATKGHLYLIDASGFIFRAYHKLPPLTRSDGTPVGAVLGFMNMLFKLTEQLKRDGQEQDYIAAVFDAARKTFRSEMYDQYKANRSAPPDDLIPQFPLVRDAAKAIGLPVVEMERYEADDVIATYTREAESRGLEVIIVSSDKDLMQLIRPGVRMYDAMKDYEIGPDEVKEKWGCAPDRLLDVLALVGDSSDNVPGIPGIGPKTACQLIHEFGDLDNLLAMAERIPQPKRRESIVANAEQARLSRELIRLVEDVPLPCPLEELAWHDFDREKLIAFLNDMEFRKLAERAARGGNMSAAGSTPRLSSPPVADAPMLPASPAKPEAPEHVSYECITDMATLERWIEEARKQGYLAIDTESDSFDARSCETVGISLALAPGRAAYIPIGHRAPPSEDLLTEQQETPHQLPRSQALAALKPLLEDPAVLKIGHNLKYDVQTLARCGITLGPIDDTLLISYVLKAGAQFRHSLDELARQLLGYETVKYEDVTGKGRKQISFAEVSLDTATNYAAEDADIALRLWQVLKPELLRSGFLSVYEHFERPLVPVIARMEHEGILVERERLSGLSRDFGQRLSLLEEDIYKLAGRSFTIGSPKQLGEVLFDQLCLPGGKKSGKSGQYGTGMDVLEDLASQGHEIATKCLDWRQYSKLISTYTDALQQQINKQTGRVHTSFSMAATSTGRLSSSDPNLQNIPIRTEEGRRIRAAFIAGEGYSLLSADYSQIELRLLAAMANIEPLKQAFREGRDIHSVTASQMFGVKLEDVTGDLRRKAKMINFGIIYGISAHGLAVRLNIPRSDAALYIEQYFAQYPGIKRYMEETVHFAREHGYVETLYGRRCHVPYINDKNPNTRGGAQRQAINAPIQGTAADIIKRAMIRAHAWIEREEAPARMLLQVHDELVFEVKKGEEEPIAADIRAIMEGAAEGIDVPLLVETGCGHDWGSAH